MAGKLKENIEHINDEMQRQEKFMGSFAHEMKTPMTSIIGYADLMRGQSLTAQEQQEAANYIFMESRRLESLSLKLLELIVLKKRDFELRQASPAAIVRGVVRILKSILAKKDIVIQCKCQEGTCMLEPDLVKSLIMNLVDNARKAIEGNGNIYILSTMTDSGCLIRVVDNGRGMEKEELSRITEAFYRVDKSRSRAQGGAGLGLALCDEIVALHNGKMTFQSVPGTGTSVNIELRGGR
jgi:signal transduction histidine kinase